MQSQGYESIFKALFSLGNTFYVSLLLGDCACKNRIKKRLAYFEIGNMLEHERVVDGNLFLDLLIHPTHERLIHRHTFLRQGTRVYNFFNQNTHSYK